MISLDFELMWGMFDKVTPAEYGAHLEGVHEVVPKILEQFTQHGIHATWATVGMLMCQDETELHATTPAVRPQYARPELSAYQHQQTATPLPPAHYFAPELVADITNTPGQEIGSHTFSHFYCREAASNSEAAFVADCAAMAAVAKRSDVALRSLVFPRNQWSESALATAATYDLTSYRGTEQHWLYRARTDTEQQNLFVRGVRLLDHYINISGHHTHATPARDAHGLVNIPASRFLRPYSPTLAPLDDLRRRRITRAMTHAAKRGEIFHLWWHPHNFGIHQAENLAFLDSLLNHYITLREQYGMESLHMSEMATRAVEPLPPTAAAT